MNMPASLLRLAALAALSAPVLAQWTSNTGLNTAVCVQSSDQAVPRSAAVGDGKTWLGWFDQRGGSYAVYVQLLDRNGNPLLASGGMLVSGNPQSSSLVGWDLISDSSGNCVLTFTDTRAGGDLDVYAYRISQNGQQLWGANGIALSNNADFEANPAVSELSDATFVFVWPLLPSSGTGSIRAQRVDASANLLLGATDIALATGTTTNEKPSFCDVVASDNASFIVQWLRNTVAFTSPRHIRAQKFASNGNALWNGAAPVIVFDSTSVPIGYQPIVQPDGAGGAVFCWHASAALFDSFVQKLTSAGVEVFAHNGVPVSLEANRNKLDPSLAYLPASGDMIVAFDRRDPGQGQRGVGVQRISAAGALLWGTNGIELEPVDALSEGFERAVPLGDGALVTYFQYPTFGGQSSNIIARRLAGNGAAVWTAPVFLCTNLAPKDKPQLVIDASGVARLAWDDERTDLGDIYAQNVNVDGTVGPLVTCNTTNYCIGAPNTAGPGATLDWSGSTSLGFNNFTLKAAGCPPGKNAIFFYGHNATAPTPFYSGFLCTGGGIFRLQSLVTSTLGTASYTLDLTAPPNPGGLISAGSTWHFQLWYRDPAGIGGTTNTSDALLVNFCD